MPGKRIPRGVKISGLLMLITAITSIYASVSLLLVSNDMLSYGWQLVRDIGALLRILGVVVGLLGFLFLLLGLGLLFMKDWAWILGIRVCEFGILVGLLILNPLVLFLSAVVFIYLRMPSTKQEFDMYGYEKPRIVGKPSRTVVTVRNPRAIRSHSDEAVPGNSKEETSIPEGFMKCPQCDTLNPVAKIYCRMCGQRLG